MSRFISYDKENDVLCADYTNVTLNDPILFDQIISELKDLADQLPQKVYLISCFQNTKIAPEIQENWGHYTQEIMKYVKGIVRYEANNFLVNIAIRTNTILSHHQGNHSHIYPSKEAALQAVRQLEQEAADKVL